MAITDNPLSAFYRGFQGAQDRARIQEQREIENALAQQLRQIQMAGAQQQLLEAPMNQALLAARLAEALKSPAQRQAEIDITNANTALLRNAPPGSLVSSASPVPAASIQYPAAQQASDQSLSNLISNAISSTPSLSLDQTEEVQISPSLDLSGLFSTPQVTPGDVRTPLPGGVSISQNAANAEIERQRKLGEIKSDQPKLYTIPDPSDPTKSINTYIRPSQAPEGAQAYVRPSTSAGGLTPNAQANVLAKAGTAKITDKEIADKYTVDGVVDWNKLILASNKKISEDKSLAAEERLKQIPAAERAKANGFIAAHKGLTRLMEEVNKFKVEGKEPGAWNRAVATALEAPPDGIFSALYQSSVGQSLTADEQSLNAMKAMVRSAVTKANAGLSQTEREIANVSQYVPKSNDTIEETLRKGALLETYLIDQVESITTDPKDWLNSLSQGKPVSSSTQPTAPVKIGRFTVTPR